MSYRNENEAPLLEDRVAPQSCKGYLKEHPTWIGIIGALAMVAVISVIALVTQGSSTDECAVMTPATWRGQVSDPREFLGFGLGDELASVDQVIQVVSHLANQSDRVLEFELSRTAVSGRKMPYAIVSSPENLANLEQIKQKTYELRDPDTTAERAQEIARTTPVVLFVAGAVHGNEPSGCDGSLRIMYELSDRSDCAVQRILDESVVVILPTQNPDGRDAFVRRNNNGFDMNRDWFARTQPETDGKLDLLMEWPPVLFIDAHEMGGDDYFFPPNADPIHHEISSTVLGWINNRFGAAMAREFNKQNIEFFTERTFDLFFPGYGDSFPSFAFSAAGMTFEKGRADVYANKGYEQYLAMWASLTEAAFSADDFQTQWHAQWVEARDQGRQGVLQPNIVINDGNTVEREVPDLTVRDYWLLNNNTDAQPRVQQIVRTLQRVGVTVEQLTEPVEVPDFTSYGRPTSAFTLPAGAYRIPMAQAQKHLVQALLGEDSYVPVNEAYDVTGWAMPYLQNVQGGYTGETVSLTETQSPVIDLLPEPATPTLTDPPVIAVLKESTSPAESFGFLTFTLGQVWSLQFTELLPADIVADPTVLEGVDVLIAPDLTASAVSDALGAGGRAAVADWVRSQGGRYVGMKGGAVLASLLGITGNTFTDVAVSTRGVMIRTQVQSCGPVCEDMAFSIGSELMLAYTNAMQVTAPSNTTGYDVVAQFPAFPSDDFFVSGLATGADLLADSVAASHERQGNGSVVCFQGEMNVRAFTGGAAMMLFNSLTSAAPSERAPVPAQQQQRVAALHASPFASMPNPILVAAHGEQVSTPERAERTEARMIAALREVGVTTWTVQRSPGRRIALVVPNPEGVAADEARWLRDLPATLRGHGVQQPFVFASGV